MGIRATVVEKFELSDGITVLACRDCDPKCDVAGKRLRLTRGDEVRQTVSISGERQMLNQANRDQRAFETSDVVELSHEEARSGNWQLVSE